MAKKVSILLLIVFLVVFIVDDRPGYIMCNNYKLMER